MWLWQTKPEVWFTYYIHVAVWCFAGIALLRAWRAFQAAPEGPPSRESRLQLAFLAGLAALTVYSAGVFAYVDARQLIHLSESKSWRWETYQEFVGCVDSKLTEIAARPRPAAFHVWCPTFPDITIELSRRHPDWELTRTNDFWDRAPLAVQHGRDAEAVVVTETINTAERNISAPQAQNPGIQSIWMTWSTHFLNQLWREPGWKSDRYLCQRGRWMAFIFANPPAK
jgi:hypothetical protein